MSEQTLRDELQRSLGTTYRLERELGDGGMSRVFVADEPRLGRKVVVKVLTPDLAAGVSASRFEREIRLVAALQQANIVPLLSAGETNGLPYYTMPFVDGLSLRARLARDGALPVADVVSVLRDVARALAYAHDRGVVHRDIKPENILLSGDAAVVADFGIAKALSVAKTDTPTGTLTQVGTSIGTPAYMSPEQAAGDPATDHRTDFYALGCLAYEMLTGAPPFAGRSPHQLFAAHMTQAPATVGARRADCPPALGSLVMRCLEKDPARRPQSAREILQSLGGALTPGAAGAEARTSRRRLALGIGLATAVVAIGAVAALGGPRLTHRDSHDDLSVVAVLPFENAAGDSSQAYFADGLSDEVSSALAEVPGVRVTARSSVNVFRASRADPKEIGAKLHVGGIVEGTVRRSGERLRVTAELVNTRDGLARWSRTLERDARDAPALQREITDGVVNAMRMSLTRPDRDARPRHVPNAEAYDLYLRGRFFSERGKSQADFEKALDYFRRAIEKDPGYAEPYVGLASSYTVLSDAWLPPDEAVPKAREAAERAIALEPGLSAAHAALGDLLSWYYWDWDRARREIDLALALNPSNADANRSLALISWIHGDDSVALAKARQAVDVDPLSAFSHSYLMAVYAFTGQADSAIRQYHESQELEPGYFYIEPLVDQAYRAKGMMPQALAVAERASRTLHRPTTGQVLTLLALGRRREAESALRAIDSAVAKGDYVPPEFLARCYAALGRTDRALDYLRQGVDAHSAFAPLAAKFPELRAAVSDPRYEPLRRRMHLE